jgi:murein endopeptidase
MNIVTTGYSLWLRRKAGLVASAAALPEVAKIVTTPEIVAKVKNPTVTSRL